MRNSAIWSVVLMLFLLAGGCGEGSDATGPTQEATSTAEKVPPAEKQAAFPTEKVFTNSIGMKLVRIPAGEFLMGSPEGEKDRRDDEILHWIRITKPFYLGAHEVTVGGFRQFVTDTGYKTDKEKAEFHGPGWNETEGVFDHDPKYTWRNPGFTQADSHPVVNVSWNDAVAFCVWLSKREDRTYRLPTEAEWEHACRAGTTTRFHHGDDAGDLIRVGNVADVSLKRKWRGAHWAMASNDRYAFTSPVGSFRPNDFGLYDMHGNASEWCQDGYDEDYYMKSPLNDPSGQTKGYGRVLRGGGWDDKARDVRSASRGQSEPSHPYLDFGFRVAAVPASQGK